MERGLGRGGHSQRFDPWLVAFALALSVFVASLLTGATIVLRSIDAGANHADLGEFAPFEFPTATEAVTAFVSATAGPAKTADAAIVPSPTSTPRGPQPTVEVGTIAGLQPDPTIEAAILDALGEDAGHFGVIVKRLSDGRGAAINPDRVFYAASLFKLAVLEEVERSYGAGTLNYDDKLTLSDEDVGEDLGTLESVPRDEDGSLSVHAALTAMVTLSDNATAVALMHLVGSANIDATLRGLGIETMSVNTTELPTTAGDMAVLMEAIYRGRGLTAEAQQDARTLLLGQRVRSGIPRGLPDGVAVGNKTGTWETATHDVAFVEAPSGTYVIAVLSDGQGWDAITRVSTAVYDALAK